MALRALLRAGGPSWRATAAATSVSHAGRRGSKNLDWFYNAIAEEAKVKVEHPVYPAEPLHGRKRARVFMDFQFGREATPDVPPSRVVFELADDIVPLTAENFVNVSMPGWPAGRLDGRAAGWMSWQTEANRNRPWRRQ